MKILIDVEEAKAGNLLDLLKGAGYSKVKALSREDAKILADLAEGIDELRMVKAGHRRGKPLEELLDEL